MLSYDNIHPYISRWGRSHGFWISKMGHIQYFRPYFLHSFTNKISSPLHSHPAPSICKSHLEGRVDEAHVQLDILPVENRGSNRLIIAEPSARGGQNH